MESSGDYDFYYRPYLLETLSNLCGRPFARRLYVNRMRTITAYICRDRPFGILFDSECSRGPARKRFRKIIFTRKTPPPNRRKNKHSSRKLWTEISKILRIFKEPRAISVSTFKRNMYVNYIRLLTPPPWSTLIVNTRASKINTRNVSNRNEITYEPCGCPTDSNVCSTKIRNGLWTRFELRMESNRSELC